jgi:hypothetical protein
MLLQGVLPKQPVRQPNAGGIFVETGRMRRGLLHNEEESSSKKDDRDKTRGELPIAA